MYQTWLHLAALWNARLSLALGFLFFVAGLSSLAPYHVCHTSTQGSKPTKKMRVMHWERVPIFEGMMKSMWHPIHSDLGGDLNCSYALVSISHPVNSRCGQSISLTSQILTTDQNLAIRKNPTEKTRQTMRPATNVRSSCRW